jgi:peptidoglycan glycosyltransferase
VNKQIRRLGLFMAALYVALFAMLNYVQVFAAGDLNDHPANIRGVLRDFTQPRGTIATADGVVIARSVPSDDRFELQREYPEGQLYAHTTGFFNFSFGADGLERSYNDELAGQTTEQEIRSWTDIFDDTPQVGNLTLTIRDDVQRIAQQELGDRNGSVVAIDPRTGGILAAWSFPSYDPNTLSSHDLDLAAAERQRLDAIESDPLLADWYRERFFPGSTFKVVTGSTGVETGRVTPENPEYPRTNEYVAPGTTRPLRNFGGSTCGGTLFPILEVSCNTAFAEMGAQTIGPQLMVEGAESWGFNQRPPIDLPAAAASNFPTDFAQNLPALAQSSIGQNDVQATPLQMALVAAGVANQGVVMTPHTVDEVRDPEGDVVDRFDERAWLQPLSPQSASTMNDAMVNVVTGPNGTARSLAIPGMRVGGKTGTAQLGTDPPSSHAWIIGFAGPEGGQAEVAVAVIVEGQDGVSEITGGQTAGPIANAVMQAALTPMAQAEAPADGEGEG